MYRALIFIADLLYRYAYFAYRPLYFWYKRRTDADELALVAQHVRPGAAVLDIGGNIGFYALRFSELAGATGVVHVFEPDPLNYRRLAANVRDCANVKANNLAVSSASSTLKLYRSSLLNVDHRTYAHGGDGKGLEVRADTIDHHLGGGRVDFIKIDIQGYEMEAFRGMERTLQANPGVVILAELFPKGLADAGSSVRELLQFFTQRGFQVRRIAGRELVPMTERDLDRYAGAGELDFDNILITRRVQ